MIRKLGLLTLNLVFCLCSGCAINPVTGEEQLMLISPQQEIEIGKTYAPEVEKQLDGKIANNELQDYINSVGQKVAHVSHRPDLEYHFIAVKHKSVNALALPGGYVFVTKGMLEKLTSEAQLASILAHEVTHIVARHASVAMSREIGIDILLSTTMASSGAPEGVSEVIRVARTIIGIRFSRQDEQEADLGGLDYMVAAGYNPYEMIETMRMLQNQHDAEPIEFFSTHPSPENRMAYLTQRIESRYPDVKGLGAGKGEYQKGVLKRLSK